MFCCSLCYLQCDPEHNLPAEPGLGSEQRGSETRCDDSSSRTTTLASHHQKIAVLLVFHEKEFIMYVKMSFDNTETIQWDCSLMSTVVVPELSVSAWPRCSASTPRSLAGCDHARHTHPNSMAPATAPSLELS